MILKLICISIFFPGDMNSEQIITILISFKYWFSFSLDWIELSVQVRDLHM